MRDVSRKLKVLACAMGAALVAALLMVPAGGGAAGDPGRQAGGSALRVAAERGEVSAAHAASAAAGELTEAQAEALTLLEERAGTYDERSVVLAGVGEERAERLAADLGASLRITRDGSYARLTLSEGTDISDVLSSAAYAAYAEDIQPDWYVELADLADQDGLPGAAAAPAGDLLAALAAGASAPADADPDALSPASALAAPALSGGVAATLAPAGTALSTLPVSLSPQADEDAGLAGAPGSLARGSAATFNDPWWRSQRYVDYVNPASELASAMPSAPLVAVIDTGIDYANPEFKGRISNLSYNASEDKVVRDHGWDVIADEQGHGTAVAGVIAAEANNKLGIAGVAPASQLLVIKASCDRAGRFASVSDLVFGLYYAIERGAAVVNMSFGTYVPADPFATAVRLAVDSDVALVAAAGNDATAERVWPAANPDVVGVGALADGGYELAGYSNFGDDDVELVAPGTVVTLANTRNGSVRATVSTGTSMAAPIVAGAVARYKAAHAHADNAEVVARLQASATDLGDAGRDWCFGFGALDLDAFVNGEAGTITFDMLTDDVDDLTRTFIVGKALQSVPEPERTDVVFDGWYHDDQLEDAYDNAAEPLFGEPGEDGARTLTVYAAWTNEDDGQPFAYRAADGASPESGIEVTGYAGKRRYAVVPAEIDGYTVVGIGRRAFAGNATVVTVALPETLVTIGEEAFADCARLASMDVPDAVTRIDASAFEGCARLQKVTFGDASALTTLGQRAFAKCPSLRAFHLGARVTAFDGSVLLGDTALATVTVAGGNPAFRLAADGLSVIDAAGTTLVYRPAGTTAAYETPAGVTQLGAYALAYGRAAAVTLADGVTSLGAGALSYAAAASVTFSASLATLGAECLAGASGIASADLSATQVTQIPTKAFYGCPALASVSLPAGLQTVGDAAFALSALASVELPAGVRTLGESAFQLTPLESVALPASLESLGKRAFAQCYALASASFAEPCALRTIAPYAFYADASLASVTLPEGLATLSEHAFDSCGLTAVAIPASVRSIEQGAFAGCASLAEVTVAAGNTTYRAQNGVLFNRSGTTIGTTLVLYPAGRANESYAIPSGVRTIAPYAFYGTRHLRAVTVPSGMSELSAYAFSHSDSLETASLPAGLESIGVGAFESCPRLNNLSVPYTVKTIARYAFYCDYGLVNLTFTGETNRPSQISRIGFAAFAYSGIDGVILPDSVSSMGQYAFAGCDALRSFAFENGSALTAMPAYVFQGCENLQNIHFGKGSKLERLAARCFEGLPRLASIDLSGCGSLAELGNYAFDRCFALSEVKLPEGLATIGRNALYGCVSLETLSVPASVSFVGRYAFTSCGRAAGGVTLHFGAATLPAELEDDWNYGIKGYYLGTAGTKVAGEWVYAEAADGTVVAVRYTGGSAQVDASKIAGKDVSAIGYGCFRDDATLEQVTLGARLTTICDYAFAGTTALSAVDVPAAVGYVGAHAFDGSGVARVSFAAGSALSRIDDAAFANTAGLAAIELPASVERIGRAAFRDSAVATVALGQGSALTTIGKHAFQGSAVTAIALPDGLTEIGDYAFYGAKALATLDLGEPTGLKIQSYAFYGTGLATVRIPAGVSYIGELAFDACTSLTEIAVDAVNKDYATFDGALYDDTLSSLVSYPAGRAGAVTIPARVTSIRFGAFEHAKVTSVAFEAGSRLATIGYRAFYGCENLTSVAVPASVTSIDRYAFAECRSLERCDLSAARDLAGIYNSAFYGCERLAGFAIPDSVREVGDRAFYDCKLMAGGLGETSGVIAIGDGAFAHSGQTYLDAPADLLTIGKEAYKGSKLRDLDLDNGVLTSIGTEAFADCADFATTELTIPDSVAEIGRSALGSLEDVVTHLTFPVPDLTDDERDFDMIYLFGSSWDGSVLRSVTVTRADELPARIFAHCAQLEQAVLPVGLVEIPSGAFMDCYRLAAVTIPDGVKVLGDECFSFANLSEVSLPDSVERLGRSCFNNCKFTSIQLPSSLRVIESSALPSTLEGTLTVPASVEKLSCPLFSQGGNLSAFVVEDGNESYCSRDGVLYTADFKRLLEVPRFFEGTLVVPEGCMEIEHYAAWNCTALTGAELPESVTSIGGGAFNSSGLRGLTFPSSVRVVSDGVLTGCSSLAWVTLPSSATSIGANAFSSCSSLTSVTVPEGVRTIGSSAFLACTSLAELRLPASVTSIGNSVYSACYKLTTFEINEANRTYRSEANALYTADMRRLISGPSASVAIFEIPEGVESIGYQACAHGRMTKVIIPSTITSIGSNAFYDAQTLAEAELRCDLDDFDPAVFRGTPYYRNASVEDAEYGLVYFDKYLTGFNIAHLKETLVVRDGTVAVCASALNGLPQIKSVYLPDSVHRIGDQAFEGCRSLRSVHLGSGVRSIGFRAFSRTGLESVSFPRSLERIDAEAFAEYSSSNATPLEYVRFDDGCSPTIATAAFAYAPVRSIYLPQSLADGATWKLGDFLYDASLGYQRPFARGELNAGLTLVLGDGDATVEDVRLGEIESATIYCYEDKKSTLWHEGWENGNTVYYLGDWNLATFKVDGRTVESVPLKRGAVVEAPSSDVVRAALADDCSFTFLGWDIDGDGAADALPTDLGSYEAGHDLVAEAVYTVHSWDEGTRVEPGCEEDGSLTHSCTVCGATRTEAIPALGHNWVKGETVAPTEGEDGYTTYACSRCDATERRDWVAAIGATTTWTVTTPPTCEEEGVESLLTPAGHAIETRAVPATGHDWGAGTVTTEPGCETDGVRTYTCAHDATHTKTEAVGALGHDWGGWVTTVAADYDKPGLRQRTCRRCGEVDEQVIPQLERVRPGGIRLSMSDGLLLAPGETYQLAATLGNPDATDPTVRWASSDESVATVDAYGTVTAVADGVAWISATDSDGEADRCQVTVQHAHVAAAPVRENEVAATATTKASYDEVSYCSVCGEELSREHVVVEKLAIAPIVSMAGYDWGEQPGEPVVSGNDGGGVASLYYYADGEDASAARPWAGVGPTTLDVGDWWLYATVAETATHQGATTPATRFVVSKATPAVTAPAAAPGLVYDGAAQALATPGATTGGALRYASSPEGPWGAEMPTAIDAGAYAVWYRVEGGANFEDVGPRSVPAAIARRPLSVTARDQAITFGESIAEGVAQVEAMGLADGHALTAVRLSAGGAHVGTWAVTPSSARVADARLADVTDNYDISYADGALAVGPAGPVVTSAPVAVKGLSYTGSPQALVAAGAAEGGSLEYRLGEGGPWSADLPAATDAGGYDVWWRVAGDADHTDAGPFGPARATIAKSVDPAVVAPAATVTRGGNTVSLAGNVTGAVGAVSFASADTQGGLVTAAGLFTSGPAVGTVTVTVSIAESANHEGRTETIEVTITEKGTAELAVLQEGATFGETLAGPAYALPAGAGAAALSYAGTLRRGGVYEASDKPPTEAGEYTVSVSCETSDTVHTGTAPFTIAPASIEGATVTLGEALTYSGSPQTQAVAKVELGGTDIGAWCDVSGNVATDAGGYTLTVSARDASNYVGVVEQAYSIARAVPALGEVTAGEVTDNLDAAAVTLRRTDATVPGTLALVEARLAYGTHGYRWVFTPEDAKNYLSAEGTVEVTVTGHAWGEPAYEWADDLSSVTATRVCANDADHAETETAVTTSEVTATATCEGAGELTYTAAFKNPAFEVQTATEAVPALGHEWDEGTVTTMPTCDEPGMRTYTCAHDASHTRTEPITALGHELERVGAVEPTCTAEGVAEHWRCTRCGDLFVDAAGEAPAMPAALVLPKIPHAPAEPVRENEIAATATTKASYDLVTHCVVCGEELSREHVVVEKLAIAPTVTMDGYAWGEVPSEPVITGNDGNGEVTLRYYADGQDSSTAKVWNDIEPTTLSAGTWWLYATVAETATHQGATTEAVRFVVGKATPDAIAPVALAPTYTGSPQALVTAGAAEGGTLEYRLGEGDGFSADVPSATGAGDYEVWWRVIGDADHTNAGPFGPVRATIARAVPALGEVTAGEVTDDLDAAAVTLRRSDEAIPGTLALEDTRLSYGTNPYTWVFTPDDSDNYEAAHGTVSVTVTGHAWGEPAYVWAGDLSSVTATRVCANDARHVETETAATARELTRPASCEVAGETTYTATFENPAFEAQSRTVAEVPALGHDWGEWEIVREASYDAPGLRQRTCRRCGEVDEQVIPQLERVRPGGIRLSVTDGLLLAPGETYQLAATLGNPDATDPTVRWASSDESVATVDAYGTVTAVADGVAWISATDSDGEADRCQVTVESPVTDVTGATVSFAAPAFAYTGEALTPAPTVRLGGDLLREGTDYELAYRDNVEVGTATVTVTGINGYTGEAEATFAIGYDLTDWRASYSFGPQTLFTADEFDRAAVEAGVTLSYDYRSLARGTDFDVSCSEPGEDGVGTIAIVGRAPYFGTIQTSYQVVDRIDISDAFVSVRSHLFATGAEVCPGVESLMIHAHDADGRWVGSLSVSDDELAASFSVAYHDNVRPGTATVTLTPLDGSRYVGVATATFTIIDPTTATFTDETCRVSLGGYAYWDSDAGEGVWLYAGAPVRPTVWGVSVTCDVSEYLSESVTVPEDCYTLSYEDNEAAGTGTVVLSLFGGAATYRKAFRIVDRLDVGVLDIRSWWFEHGRCYYAGSPATPRIRARDGFVEGEDFELSYRYLDEDGNEFDGNGVGSCLVTVRGIGARYTGETTVELEMLPQRNFSQCAVEVIAPATYDGGPAYPSVRFADRLEGWETTINLSWNRSWLFDEYGIEASAQNNVEAGTGVATLTLTGTGAGAFRADASVSLDFDIEPRQLADVYSAPIPDQTELGATPTPRLYIVSGGEWRYLVEGTDFDVVGYEGTDAWGDAKVVVAGTGNFAGTKEIAFSMGRTISGANASVGLRSASILLAGELSGIADDVYAYHREEDDRYAQLVLGTDYEVGEPTVDEATGVASVVVRGIGDYHGTQTLTLLVVDALDLADAQAYLDGELYLATGARIEPAVHSVQLSRSVGNSYYSRALKETDYVVSYGENTQAGRGTVTLRPSGNGACVGELTQEFTILGRDEVVLSDVYGAELRAALTLTSPDVYDSSADRRGYLLRDGEVRPGATVLLQGDLRSGEGWYSYDSSLRLVEGRDFVLSYADNDRVGTATVTATGINGITGAVSQTFTILDGPIDVATIGLGRTSFVQGAYLYGGEPVLPRLRVGDVGQMGARIPREGDEVTLSYAHNDAVGTMSVTITGTGTRYTGQATVEIPILDPKEVAVGYTRRPSLDDYTVDELPAVTYSGGPQTPGVTLRSKADGSVFENVVAETADVGGYYQTHYVDNKDVGTATAYVYGAWVKDGSGIPAMVGGPKVVRFDILPAPISGATVAEIPEQTFAGGPVEPELSVSYDGRPLVAGRDYTAEFGDNDRVGTATVTLTGVGNYAGTETLATFEIADGRPSIAGAQVTVAKGDYVYTGEAWEPAATVTLEGVELRPEVDYTLSYGDNVGAGEATVTVTGTGAYRGTATGRFAIAKAAPSVAPSASLPRGATLDLSGLVRGAGGAVRFSVDGDAGGCSVTGEGLFRSGTAARVVDVAVEVAGDANHLGGSWGVSVEVVAYAPGDLDGDGDVGMRDVLLARRHIVGGYDQLVDAVSADVNADGRVDPLDVVLLRRYVAGGWGVVLRDGAAAGAA